MPRVIRRPVRRRKRRARSETFSAWIPGGGSGRKPSGGVGRWADVFGPYRPANPYRHEDVTAVEPGEKVRTVTTPSGHQVRLAFPPGRRSRGAGRVVSVLHPNHEDHAHCGDVKVRFVGARTDEGQRLLQNPGVRNWRGVRYTVNATPPLPTRPCRHCGGSHGKCPSRNANIPAAPVLIYPRVEEIRALKPDGQPYAHPFEAGDPEPPFKGSAMDYGLPDGTTIDTPGGRYGVADGSFLVTTGLRPETD